LLLCAVSVSFRQMCGRSFFAWAIWNLVENSFTFLNPLSKGEYTSKIFRNLSSGETWSGWRLRQPLWSGKGLAILTSFMGFMTCGSIGILCTPTVDLKSAQDAMGWTQLAWSPKISTSAAGLFKSKSNRGRWVPPLRFCL
jgi:hypothetical protein